MHEQFTAKPPSRPDHCAHLRCDGPGRLRHGILVLAGGESAASQAPFGRAESIVVLAIGMVVLVAAMLVLAMAERTGQAARRITVALTFLALAGVGVLAIGLLAGEPGTGFLLAFGWVLAVPVPLQITRTAPDHNRRTP